VVADFLQECLQILGHYLVQDGLLGLMALVRSQGTIACAQGDRCVLGILSPGRGCDGEIGLTLEAAHVSTVQDELLSHRICASVDCDNRDMANIAIRFHQHARREGSLTRK